MAAEIKEHKNNNMINSRPILSLLIGLGFFTVILLVTMLSASRNQNYIKPDNIGNPQNNGQEGQAEDTSDAGLLAVVKEIDTENKTITLFDVNRQESLILNYTGGTNITDKYGQAIAISQIDIGSMVDALYREDKNRLTDMNISSKAWEYAGVNNLSIDRSDKIMKIATSNFKYNAGITIFDGQEFIPVDDLAEQDELTIRGFEETIWSITVTRGHGTVVLEDYDAFLGDSITIGYESMQQITEDMKITVREGEFNLTVENGVFSATKRIGVYRNQVTQVSLNDLGPDAPRHGLVNFEITPFGADLYLDGELTSYAKPIELLYGDHTLSVSLGGYTSYDGTLKVDSAGKTIQVDLPESTSKETAAVSETDTQTDSPATDNPPTGTGADTGTGTSDTSGDTSTDTSGEITQEEEITDSEHTINVLSPIGASVYIDGEYMGSSPGSFKKIIGAHVITFIADGYETMSYTIEISNDGMDTYLTYPALVPKAQ